MKDMVCDAALHRPIIQRKNVSNFDSLQLNLLPMLYMYRTVKHIFCFYVFHYKATFTYRPHQWCNGVLTLGEVNRGFKPWACKTKDYNIDMLKWV